MTDRALPGIQPAVSKKRPLWPWAVGLAAGVILLSVIIGTAATSGSRGYNANTSAEAIAQCEAAISKRLKSPSTADFNSTATGSGTWTVTGTVDAQNSFGATVRADYQCSVIIDDVKDTARVRIDSFTG